MAAHQGRKTLLLSSGFSPSTRSGSVAEPVTLQPESFANKIDVPFLENSGDSKQESGVPPPSLVSAGLLLRRWSLICASQIFI
ncbi:hypothetical protein AAC387_Pa11g1447 [Persea americana]